MRISNHADDDGRSDLRKQFDDEYEVYMKRKRREFDQQRQKYADDPDSLMLIDASEVYEEDSRKEEMYEWWLEHVVYPDVKRGRKISESAFKGGSENKNNIRQKFGGCLLEDRIGELDKRLGKYMKEHSKTRACQLLSKEPDVLWSAEYLRKHLGKK